MTENPTTVCFVIPTRNRRVELMQTLDAVGRLDIADAEVLVVDNGSADAPLVPASLANGASVRLDCLPFNEGAASRNRIIGRTGARWLVMLDDDSHPTDAGFVEVLAAMPDAVLAVSADVWVAPPPNEPRPQGSGPDFNTPQAQASGMAPSLPPNEPRPQGSGPDFNKPRAQASGMVPSLPPNEPRPQGSGPDFNTLRARASGMVPSLPPNEPRPQGSGPDFNTPRARASGMVPSLPFPRRELGGLPEVFIGCGVAIRRHAFEDLGGYDPAFGYYAEEYDLAARLLAVGGEVRFDPRFRVEHRRAVGGRDMGLIVERLVRNNGWVMQRYAPDAVRRTQLREARLRCRTIALREGVVAGYGRGLIELRRTVHAQIRTPLSQPLFDRFTGLAHARDALGAAYAASPFRTACVVDEGKNAWCVRRALDELGVRAASKDDADALVIGAMSPGPMLDAAQRWAGSESGSGLRVIAPWVVAGRTMGADRSEEAHPVACAWGL